MKIVSLLPSATEIAFALGLGDALEGVTFECDYPPEARSKAVVSNTALPGGPLDAAEIDQEVRSRVSEGESIYRLDTARISAIDPDVILTQDLCRVCAVPTGQVEDALEVLGCRAEVVSLDPTNLDDVISSIGTVGDATGTEARARQVMDHIRRRIAEVREAVSGRERPRTFALEWSEPPFSGGHWVPDMIDAAGGEPLLAEAGTPSRQLEWEEVAEAAAEVVVFMPCGYGLDQAASEGKRLLEVPQLAGVSALYAVDANATFSRPGPRVVDGVEALAWMLHPDTAPTPRPDLVVALERASGD